MKIELNTESLFQAAQMAAKATKKKTTLPILSCLLVTGDANCVKVIGTDLANRVTAIVKDQTVDELFGFAVDAETFIGILNSMDEDLVSLDFNGKELKLACGRVKSKLPTVEADDFPSFDAPTVLVGTLTPDVLFNAAKFVSPFTAKDESRPALSGICLKPVIGSTMFFGSDGYRMSRLSIPIDATSALGTYLIPYAAIDIAARLMAGDEVKMFADNNRVSFVTESVALSTPLIDAQYPDIDKVIGTEFTGHITADNASLLRALKSFAPFCERSSGVKFTLSTSGLNVSIKEQKGTALVTVESTSDTEKVFGLQYGYAMDIVSTLGANIVIDFAKNGGVRFRAENNDNFQHVLMTMQLND